MLGTIIRRRARSFSPKSVSSEPGAREVRFTTRLAFLLSLKDHLPPLTLISGFNGTFAFLDSRPEEIPQHLVLRLPRQRKVPPNTPRKSSDIKASFLPNQKTEVASQ
jgi:hypothetical protein